MTDIALVLVGVTVLFALFVALRALSPLRVCALCGAVSLSWLALLASFYLDYAVSPLLIALLAGGSVVGSMYWLESRLLEEYGLFKLPYFLTLISAIYFLLERSVPLDAVLVLGVLWLLATLIHLGGRVEGLKTLGRKIIECCKNW